LAASALRNARCAPRGHHREAAALLAGARRFHGGVEREDVGLEGDAVDHADDVGDLLGSRFFQRRSLC
jgi:hypothetical protein